MHKMGDKIATKRNKNKKSSLGRSWLGVKLQHAPLASGKYRLGCVRIIQAAVKPRTVVGQAMNVNVILQELTLAENTGDCAAK